MSNHPVNSSAHILDLHVAISFLTQCPLYNGLAYIDPNTGGFLFQLLFPLAVAIGGAWMLLRKKFATLRKRLSGRKDKEPEDSK